ncbi:unnamed protein product [Durusdinium trenchii]|uniref:Uncharacterized protein n=1 Tax=Durusdinium trenchii TaxID=1381693 RepID=A0ABP0KPF2_9DINO
MVFLQDDMVDFPDIGTSIQLPHSCANELRAQLQDLACRVHLGVRFQTARGNRMIRFHLGHQNLQYTVDGLWRPTILQMTFHENGLLNIPELNKTVTMAGKEVEGLRILLQELAALAGLCVCFVEARCKDCIRISIAGDNLLQYTVNGSWRPCFTDLDIHEDGWVDFPDLGRKAQLPFDQVYTLRSQLRELQRRSREREEDTEASETSRPQPEANGGARWLVVDADSAWKDQLVGTVVEVPSGRDQPYAVDVFAPVLDEEDAMNPFLARFSIEGLRASQLGLASDHNGGLTAIGRKNTSFCSVPLVELHEKGCGQAAHGRSARLGGLATRPELEGLTGTIIAGPDRRGQYSLKMMLEEGELDTVTANAENITLRVRRGNLSELLEQPQVKAKEPQLSEGVPFLAALYYDVKPLPTTKPDEAPESELASKPAKHEEAAREPKSKKRPKRKARARPASPRPSRPSRLVSLSPEAAAALVAAGDVSQHALTEVQRQRGESECSRQRARSKI